MKQKWIIAGFLAALLLGNICGNAAQLNRKMDIILPDRTKAAVALPTAASASGEEAAAEAPVASPASPSPKPTVPSTAGPVEALTSETESVEEPADAAEQSLKISIRIGDGSRKLVPDVKKCVRFGGVVKVEGALTDEDSGIALYIGLSAEDKESALLLDAAFEEIGDGEQSFEVGSFSLEAFEQDGKLPEALALFVGMGESREFVMDLPVDNNHHVVIYALICGGCIIAMTICIVLLVRTNRKLRREKYRLLDMQTRKSHRTVRNEG